MNVVVVQHALNSGEVSARAEGRQDQNKYLASCRVLENWLPLTVGGLTRRPGFRKVQKARYSGLTNDTVVLIPFLFSTEQAYVCEFGDQYVRFFKEVNGVISQAGSDVATPYTIPDLRFVKLGAFQSADVMYIMTANHPTMKLARIASDVFTLTEVSFNPPATQEDQPTSDVTGGGVGAMTLSATTGLAQTATVVPAYFLAGDVGRIIVSGPGRAVITGLVSHQQINIDIVDDFVSTTLASWHLEGFGNATMDPSAANANQGITVAANMDTFRVEDEGKYIVIYGGLVRITHFTDPTIVQGIIVVPFRDVPNDPNTGQPYVDPPASAVWSLEINSWSPELGYPSCGCFFQSRMWACSGQTINGSATGDFENFGKGSDADDAIQATLDDDQVNPIRWIKGLGTRGGILQLATAGSAYACTSSAEGKALAPNDFSALPVSSRGSEFISPLRIGSQLIFVQYGGKKFRELVFDFVTDKYKSPNLLILAEHLTEHNKILEVVYQQEFDSIIWLIRDDGTLMALTYQEDENVIGWSRHPTDGTFQSITVIPRPANGKDWLWAAVKRTVGTVTQTFIEAMEEDAIDVGTREWLRLQTDCASVLVPGAGGVLTGLSDLEGKTVRVIGDGILYQDQVVTGGQVTITPLPVTLPSSVEVGLDYQSIAITNEPVVPQPNGPMHCRRWKNLGIRVRHAGPGLTLNIDESADVGLAMRLIEMAMDQQVPLQEGKLCAEQLDYSPWARVRVKQTLPFPAEILNIVGELEVSDEWCCDSVDETVHMGLPPPPPPPPPTCPDAAPGAQTLAQACCYNNTLWVTPAGTASSLSHMPDDFTFWSTSSLQSGTGSSPYPISSPKDWYLWTPASPTGTDCTLTDITSSAVPPTPPHTITSFVTQGGNAGRSGKSDENSYVMSSIAGDLGNIGAYFGQLSGFTPLIDSYNCTHSGSGPWTKFGGFYYSNIWCIGSNQGYMKIWSVPGGIEQTTVATLWIGGVADGGSPLPGVNQIGQIFAMQATATALWVLKKAPTDANVKLCKLDKSALTLTTQYSITDSFWTDIGPRCFNFDVFNDDLIFLIARDNSGPNAGTVFSIGWFKPSTNAFFRIGTFTTACSIPGAATTSSSGTSAFFYKKNYFFVGGDTGNVLKLGPLVCPSNPALAWEN